VAVISVITFRMRINNNKSEHHYHLQ
jgi:hypothetical protein